MRMYLLGKIKNFEVEDELWASDLNGDGDFNSIDFAIMRQYLLGKIKEFPKQKLIATPTPTASEAVIETPTPTASETATETPTPTPTTKPVLKGDVDGNGDVNSLDFANLRMYLIGKISEFPTGDPEVGYRNADIDGNGTVDSLDFALLRKILTGK